jgi:REP element-mobilizing transposase RayT
MKTNPPVAGRVIGMMAEKFNNKYRSASARAQWWDYGSIFGGYKSAVTKHANRLGLENGWQPRFHDHIIRNDAEYQRISYYITNNPQNWDNDKFSSSK